MRYDLSVVCGFFSSLLVYCLNSRTSYLGFFVGSRYSSPFLFIVFFQARRSILTLCADVVTVWLTKFLCGGSLAT